ncbi:unnamed protein product [Nippostrongylus brasiliensis]|uniref:Uncharacterized protein n=1 Tax=Nippostrongylus brasiliensis TaxID=27835 RepID=A0A0N4Y7X6_NIPBR|nr:unnamed protein product [Nippostrongylus brasiliensis]
MDSFAMLNEEVFKHLCSLAIDKVSDKAEKRKAGCGGVAMRKRLLIKNFVNDLCRKKAEDEELEEKSAVDDYDDYDQQVEIDIDTASREVPNSILPCVDTDDNAEDGDTIVPEDDDMIPAHDIWLDSAAIPENASLSDTLMFETVHSGREGAIGRLDDKTSESRLTLYSLYSSVSESADKGEESLTACDPQESLLPNCLYDCVQSPAFGSTPLNSLSVMSNISSMCDMANSSAIQPVLAEESDQIFLALGNHKYSDLKTYNPPDFSVATSRLAAGVGNPSRTGCSAAVKRRSDEMLLFDSINAEMVYQKKIKL